MCGPPPEPVATAEGDFCPILCQSPVSLHSVLSHDWLTSKLLPAKVLPLYSFIMEVLYDESRSLVISAVNRFLDLFDNATKVAMLSTVHGISLSQGGSCRR
jgi:hypothetical protein